MNAIVSSSELVRLLVSKGKDAAEGKNLAGVDSLCRVTETMIKLARLEMDYSRTLPITNQPKQIGTAPEPSRWAPLDVSLLGGNLDESYLKAAIRAGETHLSTVEDAIDQLAEAKPKHPGVKILSAEATYVRTYLIGLRDEIGE